MRKDSGNSKKNLQVEDISQIMKVKEEVDDYQSTNKKPKSA